MLTAAVSIILSVKAYRRDTPSVKIDIDSEKFDCFFGDASNNLDEARGHTNRISGVFLTLRNDSSADIEVTDLKLKVGKEYYNLIDKDNKYWNDVAFLVTDPETGKREPDAIYSIAYSCAGFETPRILEAYRSFTGYALFYNFPAKISGKIKATLVVKTAVGTAKKRITLYEYDDTFAKKEWEEIEQFQRSYN